MEEERIRRKVKKEEEEDFILRNYHYSSQCYKNLAVVPKVINLTQYNMQSDIHYFLSLLMSRQRKKSYDSNLKHLVFA